MKATILCVAYGLFVFVAAILLWEIAPALAIIACPFTIWFGKQLGQHLSRLAFNPHPKPRRQHRGRRPQQGSTA